MCRSPRLLSLVAALLIATASPAAAQPVVPLYPPAPVYSPGVRVSPGVYVYPQMTTTPRYYAYPYYPTVPTVPPYYGGSYSFSAWGGTSYYPAYPYGGYSTSGYYFRFRFR